jgi:protein-L-isoaspartate O-methyltransferase
VTFVSLAPQTREGSKDWWANKYAATNAYLFGKAPSPFVAEHLELLRKGEALDVGMGEGRHAAYLASKGFKVTGVDFIEVAVERAKTLGREMSVTFETKLQDLDFFLIPLMKYDSIVVTDYHPSLTTLKSLARGLNKGGTLLLEGYTLEQLRLTQGYKPEAFECFKPNEALEHVRELHVILYNERLISPKESRVQLIARKPLK